MSFSSLGKRWSLVALLASVLVAGDALAQRGERGGGGRGGGGRGGDGGGRSSMSGGRGGGGGGSMRSSGGQRGGGSSRSFSGGGRSGGGRSFSSAPRGGGGSSRSFSSAPRGGDSSRAIRSAPRGGGESRSFSRGSSGRSAESVMRSGGSRPDFSSSARESGRSARPSGESFRPSNRGSFDAGQSARRSIDRGDAQSRVSRDAAGARQLQGRGSDSMRSFDSDRGRTARSRPDFSRREYQAARPTDDQVRNFLNRGQGGASRQAQDLRGRAGDGDFNRRNLGDARDAVRDRDAAGRVGGRAGDLTDRNRRDLTGRVGGDAARRDSQDRIGDANRRGDREFDLRSRGDRDFDLGDPNRGRDIARGDRGDRDFNRGDRGDRDFNRGDRGDRDFNRGDRGDRDFGGRDRNRDFARRDFDRDREFQRWRDGAWGRDGDRRGDNRDWSGKWRDGDRFDRHWSVRDRWHNRWRDRWDDDDFEWWHIPFVVGWWGHHGFHDHHWGWWDRYSYGRPWYWWSYTRPTRLWTWFDYGWNTPYYWDYGHGEYIYYDDGYMYVNGQQYQPAPVFYENTVELVERVPTITEEVAVEKEWLPLGVFAVTREGQAEADVLVQLAITQDGIIGGTVHVQASGQTFPIEGTVEKETQRAVWSYTDDRSQRILMETSIFNLTQPDATGLVQYSPDNIQVIELVRLDPPEGAGVAAEGELPAPPQ